MTDSCFKILALKVSKNDYLCIMEKRLERFKGIHPGLILDRELRKRSIKPSPFAASLNAHKQTLNSLLKGKRGISIPLALKVDKELGLEAGTFALLQTYYDIEQAQKIETQESPDVKRLRKALFWDTDISKIDWHRQHTAVIQRIFERGNIQEQEEVMRFYGKEKVAAALADNSTKPMTLRAQ